MPGPPRAARRQATWRGRKSPIKPRFDLAADLGVTTAALSQTIRIATLGDIEQNSAKFSLSDRQVPIQVSLVRKAHGATWRRSRICRCRRPAAARCR